VVGPGIMGGKFVNWRFMDDERKIKQNKNGCIGMAGRCLDYVMIAYFWDDPEKFIFSLFRRLWRLDHAICWYPLRWHAGQGKEYEHPHGWTKNGGHVRGRHCHKPQWSSWPFQWRVHYLTSVCPCYDNATLTHMEPEYSLLMAMARMDKWNGIELAIFTVRQLEIDDETRAQADTRFHWICFACTALEV